MLSAADRLRINRLAQGYEPIDSGVAWFKARSDADQLALLRETAMMAEQAGARSEDVEPAAGFGSVDRHYTAAVVLRSGPLRQQVATVLGLPLNERPRSLR